MADITELRPGTSDTLRERETITAAGVLMGAMDAGLTHAVVVGRTPDGELFAASTHGHDKTIALLTRAIAKLAQSEDLGLIDA